MEIYQDLRERVSESLIIGIDNDLNKIHISIEQGKDFSGDWALPSFCLSRPGVFDMPISLIPFTQ
jgi:hypothetical protein